MRSEYAKIRSLQGSLDLLVLTILSSRHACTVPHHVRHPEMSGEVLRVEEGSLYLALHRMEEAGWIHANWITKDSGRARACMN